MSQLSFAKDIKPLFAKYIINMENVSLEDSKGTRNLLLGSYASVKYFHYKIQVAIHGYDFVSKETKLPGLTDEQLLLKQDGSQNDFVRSAPHPMPPSVDFHLQPGQIEPFTPPSPRLPQLAIDIFDEWVKQGMPE